MQNCVDHLFVEVLGAVMKKTQILTENQSSIFQSNIVPRKANVVPEYLPKEIANGSRLRISYVWNCAGITGALCAAF